MIKRQWSGVSHLDDDDDENNDEGKDIQVTEYPYYDDNLDEVGSTAVVRDNDGNWISVIDFNEEGKGSIRYCEHCLEFGFEVKLGPKLKKHGEAPQPDDDKYLSCWECGNIYPIYQSYPETEIKDSEETVQNPFDNESTFLSTESRASQRRKGKRPRSKRFKIEEHEDSEIQSEIDKGKIVNILYDSNR